MFKSSMLVALFVVIAVAALGTPKMQSSIDGRISASPLHSVLGPLANSHLGHVNTVSESVLYSFKGLGAGAVPVGRLIADKTGALFGVTYGGGTSSMGTVFKLTPFPNGYRKQSIHEFRVPFGAFPEAGLIEDPTGTFYGTTSSGASGYGGTVFSLTPHNGNYRLKVLHSFDGGAGGGIVYSVLIADASGALYGTAYDGGVAGVGVVFKLTPGQTGYQETVLYSFKGGADGGYPFAGLLMDGSGALYGTTSGCCGQYGTVYKLIRNGSNYREHILYRFQGGADGANPRSALIADASGALYGTTYDGGSAGYGTVYKLVPNGSGYSESILHTFQGEPDGGYPQAGLIADKSGLLYGTTSSSQNGTVFDLLPDGSGYTVVYEFQSTYDGRHPTADLIADGSGAFYGTALAGGSHNYGAVFKITP